MQTRNPKPLHGIIAATLTPFDRDGGLNLNMLEKQAAHLLANRVSGVFIGGTTGESHSLTLDERRRLAQRWFEVVRGAPLAVVVHVGSNCLADAKELAALAARLGAPAIAALAPSYFRPRDLTGLVDWCAQIAAAAPDTPFYFYDIPVMTHVTFSMPDFLAQAGPRIPNLAGLKFTNYDLMAYQYCLHADGDAFDILWGVDEFLLAALALGAQGMVGSTYNFATPIYLRLLAAFRRGDLESARREQFRSAQIVKLLAGFGYMGAAKAVMKMLGVDVGPARLPNNTLTRHQETHLRRELEQLGFFEWLKLEAEDPAAAAAAV